MFSLFSRSSSHDGRQRVADGAVLLDVRTREEFMAGHVEGALNIPVQELASRLNEVRKGKGVVVYCRSGGRSATATQILRAQGHDVLDIGPMSAW